LRRRVFTVADQGVSSASTLLLTVGVARSASITEFGVFGTGIIAYLLCVGMIRPFGVDVILVFGAGSNRPGEGPQLRSVFKVVGALSVLSGLGLVLLGYALGGVGGVCVQLIGASFPGLALLEVGRYFRLSSGSPLGALAISGGWLAGFLAIGATAGAWFEASPVAITAAWCGTATGIGLAVTIWDCARPPARGELGQYRALLPHCLRYATDFLLMTGAAQGTLLGVASMNGLAGAAGLRGAQTLLGPPNVILMASATALLVGAAANEPREWRKTAKTGLVLLSGVWIYCVLVLMLPTSLGVELLGESWDMSRRVLVPLGLAAGFTALSMAATVSLRAGRRSAEALKTRLLIAPILVLGTLGAAFLFGSQTGLWSYAFLTALAALAWYRTLATAQET
jgi:hypothetical protein